MDDSQLVALYWQRDEQAIVETDAKYGSYCMKISQNILSDRADSEENVNDAYLHAWEAMPPQRPAILSAFLGRITRNLALNRCKAANAQKRQGSAFALSLDELDDCAVAHPDPESATAAAELGACISAFLRTQSEDARNMFICRYFYCDAIEEIAGRFLISTGSDKIGRKGAMLLCFAITILAIVLLTFSKGIVYVVCFWLLSFTYGGTAATMPSLTTDYLGSENAGLVCSLVMIGFGVASVGTSFLAKAVNTSMAFILAGVIAIVGILVTLALPKLGKAEQ